ncbi:MAG: HAD-IIIC family phosphatase [Bacteroidota bacterium]
MKDFFQLKKNKKEDFEGLKTLKVAVLGDTSTQFLVQALQGLGYEKGFDLAIWEADYNQIERQILDPFSELYECKPEIVILFQSAHKLLSKYNKLPKEHYNQLADDELESIKNIFDILLNNCSAKIIYYNYTEIDDAVFGNYAHKIASSFLFQLRKLNFNLMTFASSMPNLFLCDISSIQNRIGKATFFESSVYVNSEMVLSVDVLPEIASKTLDIISAFEGKFNKCLILDCDNTLWGGIISEDGMENIQIGNLGIGKAFTEFQYWIKKLKNRGIILAICSKNDEAVAKEPFEKHPDMVLHLEDIAVFKANWENKADNIHQIQSILQIGFDSMVFLDDNPFERAMVKENIPEICVPELPEDPADYLEYLYALNLFETASFSDEDSERTKLYQMEAERKTVQQKFANEDDFLQSLHMLSMVEPFNKFNTPRVAQLSHRSNQFNLRTVRYTEADIETLGNSKEYYTFAYTLEDKFGDNGLICTTILKKEDAQTLFIESWFMSCRVLKRGMEHFVLNTIADFAREKGFIYLKGEFIPTKKNEMTQYHYQNLGFSKSGDFWILNTVNYEHKKCFINRKNDGEK